MAASFLHRHMEISQGIVITKTGGVDVGGGVTETYVVSFPRVLKSVACLVDGCPERAHNPDRLRDNFMYPHWKAKVVILHEGPEPLPQCGHCGMYIMAGGLERHSRAARCK